MITNGERVEEQRVRELARSLGYELTRLKNGEDDKQRVLELDLRDVSEILFS